tara:strand:- start:3084 stop:3569 length:486 start_codon:yes stop_codon:yes gene_type:complete
VDCRTPKGEVAIALEQTAAARICAALRCRGIRLPATARLDRLLVRDNTLVALAEIKSRNLTRAQLDEYGSYLVTARKLDDLAAAAALYACPAYLFVFLALDEDIIYWPVADASGRICVDHTRAHTETQKSINGNTARRQNAYLALEGCQTIERTTPREMAA